MKIVFPLIVVILSISLLSGCTEQKTTKLPTVSYDDFPELDIKMNPLVFDFGDAVLQNGSVNKTVVSSSKLTIENIGNVDFTDVYFSLSEFPLDLRTWSTKMLYTTPDWVSFYLIDDGAIGDSFVYSPIPVNASVDFTISLYFNKTGEWTYSDNTTYVGLLSIHYVHEWFSRTKIIPFTVRT